MYVHMMYIANIDVIFTFWHLTMIVLHTYLDFNGEISLEYFRLFLKSMSMDLSITTLMHICMYMAYAYVHTYVIIVGFHHIL